MLLLCVLAHAAPTERPVAPELAATDLAGALSRVDWLGWAGSERQIDEHLATLRDPQGPYSVSVHPAAQQRLVRAPVTASYAVEATVDRMAAPHPVPPGHRDSAGRVVVSVRQAVVFRNPSNETLHGVVFRVFANGQDHRANGVSVTGAWVDNQPTGFGIDGTLLSVALPAPLPPGHRVRILLHLFVDVPAFDPRAPIHGGVIDPETTGVFGHADDAINLGHFLPVIPPVDRRGRFDLRPLRPNTEHAMFDPAWFHVVLHVPADLEPATTGVIVHRADHAGRTTVVATAALAREFAVSLLSDLRVTETVRNGVRIRTVTRAKEAQAAHDLSVVAADAVALFTDRFGPPTTAEIDVIDAPIRALGGVDHPGLVAVDVSHQGMPYHKSAAHEWAVVHGIAHQWWGNDVGNDPALAPWLDEALANHAAGLYWEDRYGADAVDGRFELEVVDRYRRMYRASVEDLPADLPAWKYTLDQYAAIVFGRGARFFEAVRFERGDDAYFAALRAYHERYAGQVADAEALLEALSTPAVSDEAPDQVRTSVHALYERWIRQAHGYEDLLE